MKGMYEDGRKKVRIVCQDSVEPLIEGVKAAETIEYNDTVNKNEFKQSWMR